jgi:hypothetical protein
VTKKASKADLARLFDVFPWETALVEALDQKRPLDYDSDWDAIAGLLEMPGSEEGDLSDAQIEQIKALLREFPAYAQKQIKALEERALRYASCSK